MLSARVQLSQNFLCYVAEKVRSSLHVHALQFMTNSDGNATCQTSLMYEREMGKLKTFRNNFTVFLDYFPLDMPIYQHT